VKKPKPIEINGVPIHAKITADVLIEAAERHRSTLDNPGFCIVCGHEAEGVEPDARRYKCEACGANGVYGVEELLIRTF
jgi:hypothetical protein